MVLLLWSRNTIFATCSSTDRMKFEGALKIFLKYEDKKFKISDYRQQMVDGGLYLAAEVNAKDIKDRSYRLR